VTWFWGVWWAWTPTGWQVCFSAGPVAMAFFARLIEPAPRLDLSDEALDKFVSDALNDSGLWP
jgi:hypothetical protein